jgi:hypothetical protein
MIILQILTDEKHLHTTGGLPSALLLGGVARPTGSETTACAKLCTSEQQRSGTMKSGIEH